MSKQVRGFKVLPATEAENKKLMRFVAPRRGATASVPDLDLVKSLTIADELFGKFGLPQFVGCVTAEPMRRPIPHVFPVSEVAKLTHLYEEWAPAIFSRVLSEIVAPVQTFNKTSRLGWDSFEVLDNKMDRLGPLIATCLASDSVVDQFSPSFIIMNVRLQAEDSKKVREFMFVDEHYSVYKDELGPPGRTVEVAGLGNRFGSRVRGVYNLPMLNLVKQVLDTAIHNVFLEYPAFHHDMFNGNLLPVRGSHLCLDVKHFERHTAALVRSRARMLGGLYSKIGQKFEQIPYCCPTDDRRKFVFLYPDRSAGFSEQFASGDSAVAPAQKEVFAALYGEYFCQTRHLTKEQALSLVFSGGDERLTIRNYGDDNSLSGDPEELKSVFSFLQQYLTVEVEEPPKFLGFEWITDIKLKDGGKWQLPISSYLTKTYLNERRPFSNFRKFPFLGWVLKREVFQRLGDPVLTTEVFPYENNLLEGAGLPWSTVVAKAAEERIKSMNRSTMTDPNWIMGKDYLMTAEQKIKSGEFFGLMPDQTAPIIKKLLGQEWLKQIRRTL